MAFELLLGIKPAGVAPGRETVPRALIRGALLCLRGGQKRTRVTVAVTTPPTQRSIMSDLLDPAAILGAVPGLLPADDKKLETPQDAVAVLLHAVMSVLGFRLVGLDDSSSDIQYEKNALPLSTWRKHAPDSFSFRYKHDQSSLVFLLKIVKLSKRLVIHGIALEVWPFLDLNALTRVLYCVR